MARTIRESRLDTREARLRFKVRGKPYWRLLEPGLHLGYRRLQGRPGSWCVRRYAGEQSYQIEAIKGAIADDYQDADGATVLSFAQAQKRALAAKPKAGPFTVQQAVEDYFRHRGISDERAESAIYPTLGNRKVEALTTKQLRQWMADLGEAPRRARTRAGERQRYLKPDNSEDGQRRRRSSANRVWTILRAALNHAWREGHVASDVEWRRVKPFADTVRARVRFLDVDECRRLINAAQGEFRLIVQAALFTGCRYSELARLTVQDFNGDAGTVHITKSKTGRARHVFLTPEGVQFFANLATGRGKGELFFRATRGGQWARANQQHPMLVACRRARIEPPVGFHQLRHSWASLSVMGGMPLMVVAKNLGHASTAMVERHYGHLSPGYVADAIRKHAPRFGGVKAGNVRGN